MGVNNNVAILSLMTKLDEKSVERVASQLGKTTEEAMSDISSNIAATFSEEMVASLKKALELASGKLKGVNLSSYTGNLLDSLFSEKDVDAKKKDLEKFIKNITNLSKSLTGLNPNSLNSMNTKQLDAVIEKQEKILAKEQEIADKRNDLEKTAGNIASKKNSLRTITQNYSTSDYTKSNEELKKLFATENKFDKAQEKSIKHLAQMLTLYSDMEKVQPQKGASNAIKYSTDLLTIVREIQKTSKQVDLFTGGKATEYITKNLSSMSKVTPYGIELSKQDYVKNGLKSLTTQKTSLEKSLTTYIVDIVQKNLQKTSDQANKVLDQAENRAEKLQTKFDNLKGGTSSQKPIVGDIVDESQLKSLDEIESRLYEIYDKDAEGNANTKELKEYINLYKQYENLIASDSTRKFDPDLKDEYNVIVNTSKAMREYADSIQIVSSEQKKMAGTENVGDSGDSNERTEQLREQEQQADKTAAAEKGLSEAQQESLETIQQDLDQAKEKINDLATRMSNLEDNNSFTDLSEQVKNVTSDIGILADKVNALFDSLKSTKEINALDVLMHGGNLDVLNNSSYQRSDALLKNLRNIFSGTGSDYGMVTGSGIFGTNDMSGIAKTDVSPNSKWYAIDFSKYHTYMVETEEEAEKLNQFMQGLNLAVIKNLGVNGEYIAPSFKNMYEDINVDALYQEYKNSFKGANLSLEEFKTTVDELADYIKKAGFELYDDDEYSYTGKNARVSEEHAYDKDISTMFYEKHGYEGINFNKLRDQHYNGYVYGSTIFNIDKNNPYFKVFDTYEEAVEYMGQISNKIDNNQTIFYDYIDKSNSKFKQDLEQVNALLQEQSRLIDEIRNKTSNSGVSNTDSSKINPIEKVDNESNISSGSTETIVEENSVLQQQETQIGEVNEGLEQEKSLLDQLIERIEKIRMLGVVGGGKSEEEILKNYGQESTDHKALRMQLDGLKTLTPSGKVNPDIRDMVFNPEIPTEEVAKKLLDAAQCYQDCKNALDKLFADNNIVGGKVYNDAYRFLDLFSDDALQMASVVGETREKLTVMRSEQSNISSENLEAKSLEELIQLYHELGTTTGTEDELSKISDTILNIVQAEKQLDASEMQTFVNVLKGLTFVDGDSPILKTPYSVDQATAILGNLSSTIGQQSELQGELKETEAQAEQTAQAVREVTSQDQMKDAFQGETGSGNGLVNEAENLNEKLEKSKQYVNEVQQAFMNIVGRTSNRNELLTQYPELSEFKNRKSVDKARSFLNTDDWKDFLSTLPEAHAYLESIGYDFDRIYKLSDEEINWFKGLDADTILQKGWNQDKNGAPSKEDYKEIRAAYQAAMQSIVQPEDTIEAEEKLDEVVQEEAASMDKIEEAAKGATQAKKDFAAANGTVQTSIDGSKTPLELEAELMERIAESARKAADAKKEFVEANKQVADSANESDSDLQTGHSENAEPTGVKKYKKKGYRAKSKGTQDNEIKVEGGKTLEQALRESQDKVKSGLNANVDIIKEITDFYDSNDNLVKTQMKVINAETKRQSTYTTSYSTDKDGNATAWTSYIDTNKIADREKQEAKEIQAEWKKNTDAIEAYMNAVTKLNNLKTVDKGTGKYSNQIELQIQKVEELRQVAYAARANLSSMINPHDMDITDWNKWLEAMKQFGQASQGSAESVAKLEDALRNVKTSTLNSVQSTIDTYEQKLNDFSNIPAGFDQSTAYKNNIESLTNAINTLKTYKEQLATQDTISNDDLNQIKEYEQDIKKATSAITSMSAAENGSTALGRDKLYNKIGDYLKRNSSMSKQFRQELEGLQRQLTTLGGDANVASLTDEFVKLQSRIREAKQEGKTFWDVIKEKAWYGLASQIGMYFGLNDFIRYIREGIDVVTELDTALTEMRKVSDETVTSLKAYQETTFDVADAVGTTAVQIQNSTADFMRLGESMDEAAESAKTANILMNVSEFESIDDATSALTSMAQAYQDLDKMTIVDKLNEVGKIIAQTYSNVWCYKNIAW